MDPSSPYFIPTMIILAGDDQSQPASLAGPPPRPEDILLVIGCGLLGFVAYLGLRWLARRFNW